MRLVLLSLVLVLGQFGCAYLKDWQEQQSRLQSENQAAQEREDERKREEFRNTYCNYNGAYSIGVNDGKERAAFRVSVSELCDLSDHDEIKRGYREGYNVGLKAAKKQKPQQSWQPPPQSWQPPPRSFEDEAFRKNFCHYHGAYSQGLEDARTHVQFRTQVSDLCDPRDANDIRRGYRDGYEVGLRSVPLQGPRERATSFIMNYCTNSNYYGRYPDGGGCNYYGCYPEGYDCNYYGCFEKSGSCNYYGCTTTGECEYKGCPDKVEYITPSGTRKPGFHFECVKQ